MIKKFFLRAAVAGAAGFAGSAMAQISIQPTPKSTLSIYGIADVGTVIQSDRSTGGTLKSVATSIWNPSQIGFRGDLDLGDNRKVYFDLGSTVAYNSGAEASSTKLWDRNAYVGLSDQHWGALTIGRQINTLADTVYVVDPLNARNSATNMNVRFGYLGGAGTTIANNFGPYPGISGSNLDRVDNAVKYSIRSPETGLSGIAMIAAGQGVGGPAGGVMAGYDVGPAKLRASFMEYKDNAGIPFKAYVAGVAYRLGDVTFKVSYAQDKIDSALATAVKPYRDQRTQVSAAGLTWQARPDLDLHVAAYRGKRTLDGLPDQTVTKFYIVPEYKLAPRASLVLVALREQFNGSGALLDTGTPLATGARSSTYIGTAIDYRF